MLEVFLATIDPLLTLFTCMALGFILKKAKILPENATKVLSRLETWVFLPALSFKTMSQYCRIELLGDNIVNMLFGCFSIAVCIIVALTLSRFFVKDKTSSELGVYQYALAVANISYFGDPIVLALFGEEMLSYYKIFTLPFCIVIYTWAINILSPRPEKKQNPLIKLINAPLVAMVAGIIVGLTGLGGYIPSFLTSSLGSLSACMGPVAMMIAGLTIANYSIKEMLKNKKVYVASLLRLIVLPIAMVSLNYGVIKLLEALFDLTVSNNVLIITFFATAAPIGLNTIVFPEAYGGNPKTGAAMATISNTLCIITLPILYSLLVTII